MEKQKGLKISGSVKDVQAIIERLNKKYPGITINDLIKKFNLDSVELV